MKVCLMPDGVVVVYENGKEVRRTCVEEASDEVRRELHKSRFTRTLPFPELNSRNT